MTIIFCKVFFSPDPYKLKNFNVDKGILKKKKNAILIR